MSLMSILAGAAALVFLLYLFQDRMIYFPRSYGSAEIGRLPAHAARLPFLTSQGNQAAYYVPPRGSAPLQPGKIWLVFGGNGTVALDWLDFVGRCPDTLAGFLLLDYPGYGECEGKPSPETILESTRNAVGALVQWLGVRQTDLDPQLAVLGHSLGAAAALNFAAHHPVQRVVLIAPFTSLRDMAKRSVGTPLCYLLRHDFDNRARLREILSAHPQLQVTIVHGSADQVIPVDMGRDLAAAAGGRVAYIEIPHADHNAILSIEEDLLHRVMMPAQP
jgi:uncharacterized protein